MRPISFEPLFQPESKGPERPPAPPATAIQRMKASPESLTSDDIGALHRTLGNRAVQRMREGALQRKRTGGGAGASTGRLPEGIRAGVEGLSGMSMNDVRVHYNSDQPSRFDALAYTAGSEIHVGPGQEKHLAHEAWHVVQQRQGRVSPTMSLGGAGVNADASLEHEADIMGERARGFRSGAPISSAGEGARGEPTGASAPSGAPVRQMFWGTRVNPNPSKKVFQSEDMQSLVDSGRAIHSGQREFNFATSYTKMKYNIERRRTQTYMVTDGSAVFYHVTSKAKAKKILEKGSPLTPTSTLNRALSAPDFNSRGFLYFTARDEDARQYGEKLGIGRNNMAFLKFTLPVETVVEVDPEYPQGLRTSIAIPARRVARHVYKTQKQRDDEEAEERRQEYLRSQASSQPAIQEEDPNQP